MPIYEYYCRKCGTSSEKIFHEIDSSFNYEELNCSTPGCGGISEKIISTTSNLIGKSGGIGFEEDYSNESYPRVIDVIIIKRKRKFDS